MNPFFIGLIFFCLVGSVRAEKKHKHHKHKHLPSHVHGEVKLDISIEKDNLLVEMESPAESILGFEYKARTSKEKAAVVAAKIDWVRDFLKYFALPDCKILKTHWRQKFTGKHHSAVFAGGHIRCPWPLHGRELEISLKKYYPSIDKIHLRLVGDKNLNKQKKITTPVLKLSLEK